MVVILDCPVSLFTLPIVLCKQVFYFLMELLVAFSLYLKYRVRARVMVFNATFSNISVISWQSVLLVEETEVPGNEHQPAASHWQFYLINLYQVHLVVSGIRTCNFIGDSDCIGSCKSNNRNYLKYTNWRQNVAVIEWYIVVIYFQITILYIFKLQYYIFSNYNTIYFQITMLYIFKLQCYIFSNYNTITIDI